MLNDYLSHQYENEYDCKLKNRISSKTDTHQKTKRNVTVSECYNCF